LITPPPVQPVRWISTRKTFPVPAIFRHIDATLVDRDVENTQKYADAVVKLGAALSVPVIDLWAVMHLDKLDELLSDGLHFSKAGNRIVYEEIKKLISAKWPEFVPENIPFPIPEFWDVNGDVLRNLRLPQ